MYETPGKQYTQNNQAHEEDYLTKSVKQVLLGNYTDETTALGTEGQIALGLTGLDAAADVRDLVYDITHWKNDWSHLGQTLLDGVGLIPLVGALKNVDEAADLVKHSDDVVESVGDAAKRADDIVQVPGDVAKIGDDFGKLGKMVDSPNIKADWTNTTTHGIERMTQRGVTQDMVNSWVINGKVLQQSSGNYIYITRDGVAVLNSVGKLVTTYTSAQFDPVMWNVVKQLFGE